MTGDWEADLIRRAHPGVTLAHIRGDRWKARCYGRQVTSTLAVIRATLDRWKAWQQVAAISREYAGRP